MEKYYRNITSASIAAEVYGHVMKNLNFEPMLIIMHIKVKKYKHTISYAKAYRAKQKAIETRFGTFKASYDNLLKLLAIIQFRNPGTCIDLQHYSSAKNDEGNASILQKAFFSFAACILAFVHRCLILCIDGTFLTGKHRDQILTTIGVDSNNQLLPAAFAFVESENTDN